MLSDEQVRTASGILERQGHTYAKIDETLGNWRPMALARIAESVSHGSHTTPELIAMVIPSDHMQRYQEMEPTIQDWAHFSKVRDEEMNPEKLKVMFHQFWQASVSPTFNFNDEWGKLQRDFYIRGHSAKVRFVPLEKLSAEPPCAGPDFKPEKK